MPADYHVVKASRSPELNRRIAAHEIGHAYAARALGSFVEFVTITPFGRYAGRCVRRGAPSPSSLAFLDENATKRVDPVADASSTAKIVSMCAGIGAPAIGVARVEFAEETVRAWVMIVELVAASVCERVMFPDLPVLGAEHDIIEARALASVICSTAHSIDALLAFAEAEAEGLIRIHMGAVEALIEALVEQGTLSGEQVDQIISRGIANENVAAERARRQHWAQEMERAKRFREMNHG